MSVVPKIDEVREVIHHNNVDIICITETWLQEHIHDNVVDVVGFNLIRLDRSCRQHGGVCMYVKNSITFKILEDVLHLSLEITWILTRPTRLPRGISQVIIGTLYHPPGADDQLMLDYLYKSLSSIESRYPNCGIILLGDFNKLNVSGLNGNFNLKQIIMFPTRGQNTLDLILTNLASYYSTPTKLSPFGFSDHITIKVQLLDRPTAPRSKTVIKYRDLRPSKRLAMRSYLESTQVQDLLDRESSCEDKNTMLGKIVRNGMDALFPMTTKTIIANEPSWVTPALKKLIHARQKALASGDLDTFRPLRNKVNRERKRCRANYYNSRVKHLERCHPSTWWKEIKKLSGMSASARDDPTSIGTLRSTTRRQPQRVFNTKQSFKQDELRQKE